jgi:hypothetical protein
MHDRSRSETGYKNLLQNFTFARTFSIKIKPIPRSLQPKKGKGRIYSKEKPKDCKKRHKAGSFLYPVDKRRALYLLKGTSCRGDCKQGKTVIIF